MPRVHLAFGVDDLDAAIEDYRRRLGADPVLVVPGAYALWRTELLNLSVRVSDDTGFRHLGIEDENAPRLSSETDVAGVTWERFSAEQQAEEIRSLWPSANYRPR